MSTPPRPWRQAGIDPARLYRALVCVPEPNRDRATGALVGWLVTTPWDHHWVNLDDAESPCTCGDATFREVLCKHGLAVLMAEGDERVLLAVGRLVVEANLSNRLLLHIARVPLRVHHPTARMRPSSPDL